MARQQQRALPVIYDGHGNVIRVLANSRAHEGASTSSRELASWMPQRYSADGALLPDLDNLRARTADLIRNNGLHSGAVQTHLDNVIGSGLQLNAKPDWEVLGVDDKEAQAEWERTTEAKFRAWAYDNDCYCDASRRKRFPELLGQAYRTYLTHFEILATGEWLKRPGSKYRTAIQIIDPQRLSNPWGTPDSKNHRAGIDLDDMGAPIRYHICTHLDTDSMMQGSATRRWIPVDRYTPHGRLQVMHVYDEEAPSQSRGKNSGVVAALKRSKMLERNQDVNLEASILNAMYAAVIESSLDWQSVGTAMGAAENDPVVNYMETRQGFHQDGNIRFNGVRIPHLYPGEQLKFQTPTHPTAAFNQFEEAMLRYLASGWNLTYEQMSRDYSKTNYSSARAGLLEAWKFFNGKQYFIGGRFASMIYSLWLEEAIDLGEVALPPGAPDFYEEGMKSAWCGCDWIGPGRGHIDPQKEAAADAMELENNLSTLEIEASKRGRRWEDLLRQRAQEKKRMKEIETEYGLEPGALDKPKKENPFGDKKDGKGNPFGKKDGEEGEEKEEGEEGEEKEEGGGNPFGKKKEEGASLVIVNQNSEGAERIATSATASVRELVEHMTRGVQEVVESARDMAMAVVESNEQHARTVQNVIVDELEKPVVPVYDKDGRLLYAKRTSNPPQE